MANGVSLQRFQTKGASVFRLLRQNLLVLLPGNISSLLLYQRALQVLAPPELAEP